MNQSEPPTSASRPRRWRGHHRGARCRRVATRELAIGVDMGGSGIKGAAVDVLTGSCAPMRVRVPTPSRRRRPVHREIVHDRRPDRPRQWRSTAGSRAHRRRVPAVTIDGIILTAANIDEDWLGSRPVT